MAGIMATRFPHKAPELLSYMATILQAERKYKTGCWASYDRQYRRAALARKDLDWSVVDTDLYSQVFTGKSQSNPPSSHTPKILTNTNSAVSLEPPPSSVLPTAQQHLIIPRHLPPYRSKLQRSAMDASVACPGTGVNTCKSTGDVAHRSLTLATSRLCRRIKSRLRSHPPEIHSPSCN